ncbi:MAG TPA: carbon-nitrogen hydrolase family protein [Anaerolineales bacterium]|nr:carbon-nitrogen hydrolase family protein [Anaerolineales bacterium]
MRIAAVQMGSQEGAVMANLAHAATLVERAARDGADFVLLPELMPSGYRWDKLIWRAAETKDGPTVRWLRETSARLHSWIGTSFLETDGRDFFNTFVLTTGEGEEAGRVRKQFPSIGEALFFKGEGGTHVIETALGRIGVAICFDAHTVSVARLLSDQSIDLMLIPHCYSIPREPSQGASLQDLERMKDNLRGIAPYYARLLGIPAVSVNKCGPARAPKSEGYLFPGLSTIVDSDGTVRAHLGAQEGVISAEVTLDGARKRRGTPRPYGRYVYPGPPGRELFAAVEGVGRIWYNLSRERRASAQAAMTGSQFAPPAH